MIKMAITAGDLVPTIKKLAVSFLEEIGATDKDQDFYIYMYLNNALRKLAGIAYIMKESDLISLSTDGYVTFLSSSQPIANMYAPLRILDPSGRETAKRTSFVDVKGWWRESANTKIHMKGFTVASQPMAAGNYVLHYLAYPATVASAGSVIEFPDAGAMGLTYFVAAMIGESFVDGDKRIVDHYYGLADAEIPITTQANIDGRGHSSGGFVPSQSTTDSVFRRRS